MFIPEYSITSEILNNISAIEYGKALIENSIILPHWDKQLKNDSKVNFIKNSLEMDSITVDEKSIKMHLDNTSDTTAPEIVNFNNSIKNIDRVVNTDELDEDDIKKLHKILTDGTLEQQKQGKYRSSKAVMSTKPEQILAEMVNLFDWYNSLDAKQTHPMLLGGIIHGQIKKIQPFDRYNFSIASIIAKICMKIGGYSLKGYISFEAFFNKNREVYERALGSIVNDDFTFWLEYYTDAAAREVSNQKEKIMLLSKDSKITKAAGQTKLTPRQEKIIMFLQNYGVIRNNDFEKLFPNVSEDTVLRTLKKLIDKDIVVKKGKTKASRYELA